MNGSGENLGIAGVSDVVEVARGGFSTVFRARQGILDRVIAIKLIHATVADAAGAERFLREVKAAGRLSQHPNVAPIYDAGTLGGGQPYLIMPFYPRGSLAHRIDEEGALDEVEATRLGETLANALEYVHQHGVLHRDIKPSNILLNDVGEPLLCDFGVARLTDASVAMHTTGTSVVTWAYGPPEAFTGGEPTPAWDVYSLGATIYTMLTGTPPFIDGNDVNIFAVLNRIGNVDVPDLRDRGISPPLADAVRQAMAKVPGDRPSSAAEFGRLLTRGSSRTRTTDRVERVQPLERVEPAPRPFVGPPPEAATVAEPPRGDEGTGAAPMVAASADAPGSMSPVISGGTGTPAVEPSGTDVTATGVTATKAGAEPEAPERAEPKAPLEAGTPAARETVVPQAPLGALPVAVVVLAIAGAVLNLLGASQPFVYDTSLFASSALDTLQVLAPSAVLLAFLLFMTSPGTAAEWLVGAGAAFLALDYTYLTTLLAHEVIDNDADIGWYSLVLRSAGAIAVLLAMLLAWRSAAHHGPRVNRLWAVALIFGAALVFVASGWATDNQFSSGDAYGTIIVAAAAALMIVLLARAFALRRKTNAAPALVAAGLTGAILWGLEALQNSDHRRAGLEATIWLVVGFGVILAVGLVRWSDRARSRA